MSPELWVLLMLGAAMLLLIFTRWSAEWVLLAALVGLVMTGVVSPQQAVEGFANEGMITVGFLYVMAAGIRETGAFDRMVQWILGRPKNLTIAQARLMFPVALGSGLMNNTPLVATLLPYINDWAKRMNLPVSRLLMPLSFAAILGGMCTLIGTSTNLVVYGMMPESLQQQFGIFDIAMLGIPVMLLGLAYMLLAGRWLLPDRQGGKSSPEDPRSYTVEMMVEPDSPLAGKTIEKAGLRHLSGMYLMEIGREGHVIPAVGSDEVLRAHDRLVFIGVVDSVKDLKRIKGIRMAEDQVFKLDAPGHERTLVEAVVSEECPIVWQSIRAGRFRSRYQAAVISVSRGGHRLQGKLGDIVLRPGDVLLLEGHANFAEQQRYRRDFHLVSQVKDSQSPRRGRAWIAWSALAVVVGLPLLSNINWVKTHLFEVEIMVAAMLGALLVIAGRCVSVQQARRAIDWQVLLVIAVAFGLSNALVSSGSAAVISQQIESLVGQSPYLTLAVLFIVTTLLSNLITNNAAAALMVPLALKMAEDLNIAVMPLLVTVMIAASCGLATPISYQTNLMVYGPGGYRFWDYLRFGVPLTLLVGIVTIILAPVIWPFT